MNRIELIEEILRLEKEVESKNINVECLYKMSDDTDVLCNIKEAFEIALAEYVETEIKTENNVEEIKVGDYVMSKTGKTILRVDGFSHYSTYILNGFDKRGRIVRREVKDFENYVKVDM